MPRRVESALADDWFYKTMDIDFVDEDIRRSNLYLEKVKADMKDIAAILNYFQADLRRLSEGLDTNDPFIQRVQEVVTIPQIREVEAQITKYEELYDELVDKSMFLHGQHRGLLRRRKVLFDSLGY
jgi:hypothetical protein